MNNPITSGEVKPRSEAKLTLATRLAKPTADSIIER